MGLPLALITLSNDPKPDRGPIEVDALVDTGAINLCNTGAVRDQRGLKTRRRRVVEMADGCTEEVDVVAPVTVQFENRETSTTAFVLGNEVMLGAVAMPDMDVLLDPRNERLILPPDRPNFACARIKHATGPMVGAQPAEGRSSWS